MYLQDICLEKCMHQSPQMLAVDKPFLFQLESWSLRFLIPSYIFHKKKCRLTGGTFHRQINYFSVFSHFWFATPQLVLQADWQDVWHSPHPPFFALSHRLRVSRVLILSILSTPFYKDSIMLFHYHFKILSHPFIVVKNRNPLHIT